MMEVNALLQSASATPLRTGGADRSGSHRNEALAENRKEVSAEQLARADDQRARAADELAQLREAVARVVGANTRLSISRTEQGLDFVYRAIDVDTGEVVSEWPQETFIQLIRGVRDDVRTDVDAGLILDHVA